MTVAMVLTITRLTANGGCHFVFDLVLFRLRSGGYGCGSGAYCCNGGGSCSRFRCLEGDDAGLVRWIAAEMVVRCCVYGYSGDDGTLLQWFLLFRMDLCGAKI